MGKLFWGHFNDAPGERLPTSVAGGSRQGPVRKTLICSYKGGNFVSERDDTGSLNIYFVGSEPLTNMIEDARPCGCSRGENPMAVRIQKRNEELRRQAGGR